MADLGQSVCCGAGLRVASSDEGTSFYVCTKCGNPSDAANKGGDSMNTIKTKGGLSVEDFLEREAGGSHYKAIMLADLGSAVEGARLEWEYDESPEGRELYRRCEALDVLLKRLSITRDELTFYRQCARCGGDGQTRGENPCVECGGSGSVHAEEADG